MSPSKRSLIFFVILLSSSVVFASENKLSIRIDLPIFSCITKKNAQISLELSQEEGNESELVFTYYSRNGDLNKWFNVPASNGFIDRFLNGSNLYVISNDTWYKFSDITMGTRQYVELTLINKNTNYKKSHFECRKEIVSRLPHLRDNLFKLASTSLREFILGAKG